MGVRSRLGLSVYFFTLAFFNLLLVHAPFFIVRKKLLQLLGWNIGKGVAVHRGVRIFSLRTPCRIGAGSIINANVLLDNRRGIEIGCNVSISQGVEIYTLGHDLNDDIFATKGEMVKINDYAVLFSGATVMPGAIIGSGAVVLPGAVVTRNVAEKIIVGGVPAVEKGRRTSNLSYKLDYRVWFGI